MSTAGRRGAAEDVGEGGFTLEGGGVAVAIVRSVVTTLLGAIVGHDKVEDGRAAVMRQRVR